VFATVLVAGEVSERWDSRAALDWRLTFGPRFAVLVRISMVLITRHKRERVVRGCIYKVGGGLSAASRRLASHPCR
jgi:hypothetical protein